MTVSNRGSKLSKFKNHMVNIIVKDHRYFSGQLLDFDSHLNIVLKDAEEYRKNKRRKAGQRLEIKRNIGLIILRGDNVLRVDVVGPPPPSGDRLSSNTAGSVLNLGQSNQKQMTGAGINIGDTGNGSSALSKPTAGIGTASSALGKPKEITGQLPG